MNVEGYDFRVEKCHYSGGGRQWGEGPGYKILEKQEETSK